MNSGSSTAQIQVNPASELSELDYQPAPVFRAEHREDTITRIIEQQTAKIPSDIFLFLGLGAMAASLVLELWGRERQSRFVGMWPPSLLILGLYNKLVKSIGTR